jgi:hypothetical protein
MRSLSYMNTRALHEMLVSDSDICMIIDDLVTIMYCGSGDLA